MQLHTDVNHLIQLCKNYLHQENNVEIESQSTNSTLLSIAQHHRVTIPLAKYLQHQFESDEDTQNLTLLKEYNEKAKVNMLRFTQESIELISLFKKLDLYCFCLKGPITAKQIFNDYTGKDSRDIDLLIEASKLTSYIKILEEKGYSSTLNFLDLNKKQQQYFKKVNNQLAFFNVEKKIMLELHWRLFANDKLLSLTHDKLLAEQQNIKIANQSIAVFSNEHLLFYLIVHGAKHKWSKLYWLLEIAVFIQQNKLNWTSTLHQAKQLKIDRMCFQAFGLIEDLFDIKTPINEQNYNRNRALIQLGKDEIFSSNNSKYNKSIKNYWLILAYKMKLKKGLSYKLNYFHFISIQDFHVLPLPEHLFELYYFCRPFLWTKRYLTLKFR